MLKYVIIIIFIDEAINQYYNGKSSMQKVEGLSNSFRVAWWINVNYYYYVDEIINRYNNIVKSRSKTRKLGAF